MNDQLVARLKGIREILMAHHRAGKLLPDAIKGVEREALEREFLERVFPLPYRFGSRAITDAAGRVSGQLDIVVEWPFCGSFPAPGGMERLYLAESVAFVIEVKSDLSAQWYQIEKSVAGVRCLRRRWYRHLDKFPKDFMFQLTQEEFASLKAQFATSNLRWGGRRKAFLVFTEHGALQAANVLKSERANKMSVYKVFRFCQVLCQPFALVTDSVRQIKII